MSDNPTLFEASDWYKSYNPTVLEASDWYNVACTTVDCLPPITGREKLGRALLLNSLG